MIKPSYLSTPSVKAESVISFDTLHGGLNTYELPYRIGKEESPSMKNMIWKDGALRSRGGQAWFNYKALGTGYAVFDGSFYGKEFYHIGSKIYCLSGELTEETDTVTEDTTISDIGFCRVTEIEGGTADGDEITVTDDSCTFTYLKTDIAEVCDILTLCGIQEADLSPGVFFRYQDSLFYKAKNVYIKIDWNGSSFTASDAAANSYTPVIIINAHPANGSGDEYQPENRLSPKKTIWYNVEAEAVETEITYQDPRTFSTRQYFGYMNLETILEQTAYAGQYPYDVTYIKLDGANASAFSSDPIDPPYPVYMSDNVDYTYSPMDRILYFSRGYSSCINGVGAVNDKAPELTFRAHFVPVNYYLPVKNADVDEVSAVMTEDGTFTTLTKSTAVLTSDPTSWNPLWDGDYVYWSPTGHVLFKKAPHYFVPFINNTVRITYTLANTDAYNAIMSCDIAKVYGGDTSMCVVLSGGTGQENAFFWNGNNISMDPTYFPMTSYNLVGDNYERITGFGIQQGMLVIFKEHSIWKSTLGTQSVSNRLLITFDVTGINEKKGCDLPKSIQLIDNNLVFCNTDDGINILLNTSSADENNVFGISRNVNGTDRAPGILAKARKAGSVVSFDDGERYILLIGTEAYVWDYTLSNYKSPSYFYAEGISAVGFVKNEPLIRHLNEDGRISVFGDLSLNEFFMPFAHTDYGEAIHKEYTTPTLYFGTYDNLKDVTRMLIQTTQSAYVNTEVAYITDCEERKDFVSMRGRVKGLDLRRRNLMSRDIGVNPYSVTFLRKPGCRHVHYFSARFSNDEPGADMSISAIQIFYKIMGRIR